jgi:hypothetical protein
MTTPRRKTRAAFVGAVYPDFKLTDEQWNEIAKLGSSSVAAEARLEATVGIHRLRKQRRSAGMLPAEVRKELMAIAAATWDLQERLRSLEQSQLAPLMLSFANEKKTLRSLEVHLNLLAGDIPRGKKGRDAYFLVQVLDDILCECTGKGISRSNKRTNSTREYVKMVCRIADPDIGDGTIEWAMKDCIKRRRAQRVD